ncbi:hypothetical protein [Salinispora sp. H7-4]|uniref:hypothetical protein n=1 Tax=Salinispora sp. H7-4 TaxID=2748321 RepID=UPI002101DDAE|nr:hypothetical protein [Salinispora sp. H7-4]
MTMSEQELRQLEEQAYDLPRGLSRSTALDAVFRHADAAGHDAFAFEARMRGVREFHYAGDPTRAFLAFSWCLSTYDANSEVASRYHGYDLLWQFKWIVWSLPQFPEIPLDRTVAVLDDMQRRYQLGGHSLHAVYQHRWLAAHHTGDLDAAQLWYDELTAAKRDNLSDCRACVPSSQVRHLTAVGRFEEAVAVGQPYVNGGCNEQPHWILSELMLPYVITGRLDKAVEAHRVAYRNLRDNRHHLDNLALQVQFCGRTGNEQRGLELIERYLPWLERPSTPYAAMEFASASALVLARLCSEGHGSRTVRRRFDDGRTPASPTVQALHDELAQFSLDVAARFDARNGNTFQTKRIKERLAAVPLVERLPLTVLAGKPAVAEKQRATDPIRPLLERVAAQTAAGDSAAAATTRLQVAFALRDAALWEDAAEAAEEAVRCLDREKLIDDASRGRYLLWQLYAKSWQHRDDAKSILDELLGLPAPPDQVPPAELLLEEAADVFRNAESAQFLLKAADLHRRHGDCVGEHRALRKALPWMLAEYHEAIAPRVLERFDALTKQQSMPETAESLGIEVFAARILAAAGKLTEALSRLDFAIAGFRRLSLEDQEQLAALWRARVLLRAGRAAGAERIAREVLAIQPDDWTAAVLVASALRQQGQTAAAEQFIQDHNLDECDLEGYDDTNLAP